MVESKDSFSVKAPTRADLAGGTLDLWPIYCLLGSGKTINVALDLFAHVDFKISSQAATQFEVIAGKEKHIFQRPLNPSAIDKVTAAVRFPVCVVSHYLSRVPELPRAHVQIQIKTDAPVGSGLGGSSTLCVAITKGLSQIFSDFSGTEWHWEMLDWVRDVEAHFLKLPTGVQDYQAALFGGLNCFSFGIGTRERVAYSPNVLKDLSQRLLILFSGESHHSGKSNWDVFKAALEGNKNVLNGFQMIKGIAVDLDEELKSPTIRWDRVGKLMSQEWNTRRKLFEVHTPRLDEIVKLLTSSDVLGVKVCGAAQGGSLAVLIEPQDHDKVANLCKRHNIEVLKTSPTPEGVTITPHGY